MAGRVLLVAFAALALCVGAMGFAPAHAGSGPFPVVDMFTTYQVEPLRHSVVWTTCGNRPRTVGCYGGGKLGGFQRVCALLQGLPERRGNVVSRAVYVLDGGAAEGVPLVLSVYRRTDAFSQSDDMTTVRLLARVRLLATGGPATSCFFAANSHSLYVGSSTSPLAERVDKGTFGVTTLLALS